MVRSIFVQVVNEGLVELVHDTGVIFRAEAKRDDLFRESGDGSKKDKNPMINLFSEFIILGSPFLLREFSLYP